MKFLNKILKKKISSASVYDSITNVELPNGLKAIRRNSNSWISESREDTILHYIERLDEINDAVPTIFAEEDLGLYLASIGQIEIIDPVTKGVQVRGSAADQPIKGYLVITRILGKAAYLILTFTNLVSKTFELQQTYLDIANGIEEQLNEEH